MLACDQAPKQIGFTLGSDSAATGESRQLVDAVKTAEPARGTHCLEHPGTVLTIDGTTGRSHRRQRAAQRTPDRGDHVKKPDGKEIVAYTAFSQCSHGSASVHPGPALPRLSDEKEAQGRVPRTRRQGVEKYVKDRGLQSLRAVYFTDAGQGIPIRGAGAGPADFNRQQHEIVKPPNPAKFLWPFTLDCPLLFDKKEGYCDDVARARGRNNSAIGFDFRRRRRSIRRLDFPTGRRSLTRRRPSGPRGSSRTVPGARLDPSDQLWRGIFLRDMPLFLPTPPIVSTEFPFLQRLIDTLNEPAHARLRLAR